MKIILFILALIFVITVYGWLFIVLNIDYFKEIYELNKEIKKDEF